MNIYNSSVEKVRNGTTFRVFLESRSLVMGDGCPIAYGKFNGELGVDRMPLDKALELIEHLYEQYKNSVPSERNDNKRRRYFIALPEHELTDEDMAYGIQREEAQIKLELTILCLILNGSLVWDEVTMGKWFWQSKNDKDLVILRQWVDGVKIDDNE